jgi:Na+-driven multidrug efflux pump
MFSNRDLRNLMIPLFIEQFLLMFVGIADTFVVSFSSEADVSGVSLVTSFNTVLIFLFTALSAGGAVIISQYIGSKKTDRASRTSSQLLMISVLISIGMTVLILCFRMPLLHLLFGKIEQDVMNACEIYLFITTLSLSALAIYDAGAALCRSIGKTNVTMYISIVANVINVAGNVVGVFWLHLGAAGVAYPSLISRILSAVAVTAFCFRKSNAVRYQRTDVFSWDGSLLKKLWALLCQTVWKTVYISWSRWRFPVW